MGDVNDGKHLYSLDANSTINALVQPEELLVERRDGHEHQDLGPREQERPGRIAAAGEGQHWSSVVRVAHVECGWEYLVRGLHHGRHLRVPDHNFVGYFWYLTLWIFSARTFDQSRVKK